MTSTPNISLKFKLKELAALIDCEVVGNSQLVVLGVSSFEGATGKDITFADSPKFLNRLNRTRAGAVIVPWDFIGFGHAIPAETFLCSLVRSKNPRLDFFRVVELFHPVKAPEPGISTGAALGANFTIGKDVTVDSGVTIGDNVTLGDHVYIMPGVFVGDDVTIGNRTVIKPNVTIMDKTKIGQGVVIHPGSVIGSDGFGFTPSSRGHAKLVHAGFVQIDDQVEIGACNTIDRGTLGRTWIQRGVKTDNLVHIAHNVIIGENSLIVAQVGIAGSSVLGKNVIIAGQAGISGHLTIGDNAIVGPGAGVLSDVPPGEVVSGVPQMPHGLWLKVGRIIPRLPDLRKRLLALEKRINTKESTP